VARPGFAFGEGADVFSSRPLKGRTARVVVTMGMPAFVYRWFYSAHSVRALERNVLAFIGIAPVGRNLFGGVEKVRAEVRERWQADMHRLGRSGR